MFTAGQPEAPTRDLPRVRAVFFDAVGTLFRLRSSVGETYAAVAAEHGIDVDVDAANQAFAAVYSSMPAPATTREPRIDDGRDWWRDLVDQVLSRCGTCVSSSARVTYFKAVYASFTRPGVWELFPEVDEQLATLSKKYSLGVISNFDGRLRAILETLGVARYFRHLVISSEVGADKPDSWIFSAALQAAGVAPEEALHVGDDPVRDWQGAAAAGMQVFPLVRGEQTIEDVAAALQPKPIESSVEQRAV